MPPGLSYLSSLRQPSRTLRGGRRIRFQLAMPNSNTQSERGQSRVAHPAPEARIPRVPEFRVPVPGAAPDILALMHGTTILALRHKDHTVLAGDGQVTLGATVVKQGARKIRRLYNETILAGFAGSAADSFALFARFEDTLEQYRGNLAL